MSQRQQGGAEKSKPAGFVADGQFQPKCLGSEFSRQIAVDFESNANLHKRGSCPGHSHLPFLSEERQTYSGPFQVARSTGRDMRQRPAAELACRPSLRSSRASEANVPERAIAHRQKRADRRLLDAGTRWKSYSSTRPQSATCAERVIRLLSPPLLVVPRSASRVSIHSPPPRCFSALVSSRRLAPVPPLGSLEMTSVFPCFCPSSY